MRSSSSMLTRIVLSISALILHALVAEGKIIKPRPKEFVPTKILQWGCIPFVDFQCPATMECLVDLNYAYWGQCFCKTSFLKRFKPPHDTGLELHRPSRHDCVNYGSINVLTTVLMLLITFADILLTISSVLMIYRVWKHGGLKANATAYAMILLLFTIIFQMIKTLDYALNRAGWDPNYHFHDRTFFQMSTGIQLTNTFLVTECICTWFDLWKRSTSMSKKTSALTIFIRTLIRMYGIVISVIYGLSVFGLITNARGKNLSGKMLKLNIFITNAITLVFGFLIRRVLCKNMKDVSNPNWKAASAIQTTAITHIACSFIFQGFYKMSVKYGIYASGPVVVWESCVLLSEIALLVNYFNWFDYLFYCNRRYLESYDTTRISEYFGFSTIARLQSSVMMSSATSSMQMMSSVSSVASTVEADQPAAEKATVA